MAHIEHSFLLGDNGLMLSKDDAKILFTVAKKALSSAEKMYDKYQDILDGGEATDKEQDKYAEAEYRVRCLGEIVSQIEDLIK